MIKASKQPVTPDRPRGIPFKDAVLGVLGSKKGLSKKQIYNEAHKFRGPQLKRNNFHVDKALEGLLEDDLIHQKANGKYVLGSGHSEQSESSSSDGEAKVIVYFEHVP